MGFRPRAGDHKMDPRVLVCAQKDRGHVLQQHSAVLFVWPHYRPKARAKDQKMDPRVLVCAQRGRGHILQQNNAGLFVWLH